MLDCLAIIGFILGIFFGIVGISALLISINIYNATGEFRGLKRHRLMNSLRVYLRRTTNTKAKGIKQEKNDLRSRFLSWWLLCFPNNISKFINKQQLKEIKRSKKNKRYSSRLAEYGLSGVLAFASNEENDIFDSFVYTTMREYIGQKDHDRLISFVKIHFSPDKTPIEEDILNKLLSGFWGLDENQKELGGVVLYLHWYRIHVLNKTFSHCPLANLLSTYKKFNNPEFYKYFTEQYTENIRKIHMIKNELGNGWSSCTDVRDNRTVQFLMLLKYYEARTSCSGSRGMNMYIDMWGSPIVEPLKTELEKEFKEQLEIVGGHEDMTDFIVKYIRKMFGEQ